MQPPKDPNRLSAAVVTEIGNALTPLPVELRPSRPFVEITVHGGADLPIVRRMARLTDLTNPESRRQMLEQLRADLAAAGYVVEVAAGQGGNTPAAVEALD